MKRIFILAAVAALALSCSEKKPQELYVPKNTVEFAGNAFTDFSLGSDVKLYATPNPDNKKQWLVQAVVPVRKETKAKIADLDIRLTPLDDRGIRVRDGFAMEGEDLEHLVPVYNAGDAVERTIVFSVAEDGVKKYFSLKEANELLSKVKGIRMDSTVSNPQPAAADKNKKSTAASSSSSSGSEPLSLNSLCNQYGVYGLLSQYESALKNDNSKRAKQIEDQLWSIEKKVKNDYNVPEWLRKQFVDYIEDREDAIEEKWD
jgi:hypothetical protein